MPAVVQPTESEAITCVAKMTRAPQAELKAKSLTCPSGIHSRYQASVYVSHHNMVGVIRMEVLVVVDIGI